LMASPRQVVAATDLPGHEAERLLVVAAAMSRAELVTVTELSPETIATFRELVARRIAGEPLQYLEGTVQFGPLELLSDPRALIPRPETEQLWEKVVAWAGDEPPAVIVDLCTGSGNLALALKHSFRGAFVWATDLSPQALSLARENGARTGLRVDWLEGDLFSPLPEDLRGRVDMVVSNPPYVAESEVATLPDDVGVHEPRGALVAGERGDEVLAAIAAEVVRWLSPGGRIALEIGETQGRRTTELFGRYDMQIEQDLSGRDRFGFGRLRLG
jgi:release factor glutamine methyltransferase